MKRALFLIALLGLCGTARADSEYSDPAERRFSPYVGDVDKCDDQHILTRIQSVFRTTQNAYWKQDLQLTEFDRVRELSLRGDGTEYIPRRFCIARGHFTVRRLERIYGTDIVKAEYDRLLSQSAVTRS